MVDLVQIPQSGVGRERRFASRDWDTVTDEDSGDYGGDPSTDAFWKLWPSIDHELHLEWGLCGGSRMAGLRADLSGRRRGGKGWTSYNFFCLTGIG